jgi:hypothetical protein
MLPWIAWRKPWKNIPEDNKFALMKKFFLFIVLTASCYTSFAQYILEKRSKIKNKMEKNFLETNRKYSFTETPETIAYALADSITLPATYTYFFDEDDRCEKIETLYSCDSCMQIAIQKALELRHPKWKKVGPEKYYAGFPYNTLMEALNVNGQFILRLTKTKRRELKGNNN